MTVKNGGKVIQWQGEDMAGESEVNVHVVSIIQQAEEKRAEAYQELGMKVFELVRKGAIPSPELMNIALRIEAINEEIASYVLAAVKENTAKEAEKPQWAGSVEAVKCPFCDNTLAGNPAVCPACKTILPAARANPQAPVVESQPAGDELLCPHCGDAIDEDTIFCLGCGKDVGEGASLL